MRKAIEIRDELAQQGLVEAELLAHHRHRLCGCRASLSGHCIGRIAGHELQQQKAKNHDAQHRRHGLPERTPERDPYPAKRRKAGCGSRPAHANSEQHAGSQAVLT